jgi:hypothetical protein
MARDNRFSFRIKGQKQTIDAFKKLPDVLRVRTGQAVEKTAQAIVARMKATVRVDKGILKEDLDYQFSPKTGKATTGIKAGSARRSVGHLVEFGHGGPHPAPAYPFAVPAAEAEREGHLQRMKEAGQSFEKDMEFSGDPE